MQAQKYNSTSSAKSSAKGGRSRVITSGQVYAENRRARFDYDILEAYEAGIRLLGHEVKSVKAKHMSLKGAFVIVRGEEAYLINAHIPPYQAANVPQPYDPDRQRKLLLHKSEVRALIGKSKQKGLTLVPLKVYNKRGKIKLEFALARGKRKADKRERIREREERRKMERAIKGEVR